MTQAGSVTNLEGQAQERAARERWERRWTRPEQPVARIDMYSVPNRDSYAGEDAPKNHVMVITFSASLTPKYENWFYTKIESHVNKEASLDEMIKWCHEHGYSVRQWAGGARAWKGRPQPIRNRHEIRRLREKVLRQRDQGLLPAGLQIHTIDYRYDL